MKISFITTVFNEEKTIRQFLVSLFSQTKLPNEIIIVDGGSRDATVSSIKYQVSRARIKEKGLRRITFKILVKEGNRSVGRNEAIRSATGDVILCSDAGNILDKNWIKNISKPFKDSSVDVVAGYYKGRAKTIFQKCLIPYALVMPDKVDPQEFLPATRSIAFTKKIWKKVGRFDEQCSHNEDYVFARRLKEIKAKIVFAKDAVVYWLPRKTFKEAFVMFFRFALGDAESKIMRPKVILLFLRYAMAFYLFSFFLITKSLMFAYVLSGALIAYIIWACAKHLHYVAERKALFLFPLLQFTADAAVLSGTFVGLGKRVKQINYQNLLKNNVLLLIILGVYTLTILAQIEWGIPNPQHPFMYNMDEWHGTQSVRSVFKNGTSNIPGAAYGAIFFYYTVGLYLVPFMLLHLVDPFAIKSSVTNLEMQHRLLEILRLNTLLYGIGAIVLIAKIVKDFFRGNVFVTVMLFTFTPIWLLLGGYFKYDIAVTFWILLALYFILKYSKERTISNLLLSAIVSALAIAIKIAALPLIAVFIIGFFLFTSGPIKKLKSLFASLAVFAITLLLFGFPDIVTKAAAYYDLLNVNLGPGIIVARDNYLLGAHSWWGYLLAVEFPTMFGYFLILGVVFCFVYWSITFISNIFRKQNFLYKKEVFILLSLLFFLVSLIPLGLGGGTNRALVLLPFLVIIFCMTIVQILQQNSHWRKTLYLIVGLGILFQIVQSYAWLSIKLFPDPRQTASIWIEKNITAGSTIGLESIPIYEKIPDYVLKEFYLREYNIAEKNIYNYVVIDAKARSLPATIILTNTNTVTFMKQSPKKDLLQRMAKEGYKKIAIFTPDFRYYRYYGDDRDFFLALIIHAPTDIAIYKKNTPVTSIQ